MKWEHLTYCGIVSLLLLPMAFLLKGRKIAFFKGLLICGYLLMLGSVSQLPVFSDIFSGGGRFRHPLRISIYVIFALAVLAARALDEYDHTWKDADWRKKWLPVAAWLLALEILLIAVYMQALLISAWQVAVILISFLSLFSAQLLWRYRKQAALVVALVLCLDIMAYSSARSVYVSRAQLEARHEAERLVADANVRFMSADTSKWCDRHHLLALKDNAPGIRGILSFSGNEPSLPIGHWLRYQQRIKYLLQDTTDWARGLPAAVNLLRIAGVGVFTTNVPLAEAGWQPRPGTTLYTIQDSLPRAFFCRDYVLAADDAAALRALERFRLPKGDDGEKQVLYALAPMGSTGILSETANRVTIENVSREAGYLILSDTYYPGWRAYVDGLPVEIVRANYLFRAVELSPGKHIVEFIYHPTSFHVGMFISLLCLLFMAMISAWGLARCNRVRAGESANRRIGA